MIVQSIPQETDYIYQATEGPFPPSIDLKPDVFEVDDYKSIESCVANAITSVCEDILKKDGRGVSLSRLFVHWVDRKIIMGDPNRTNATLGSGIRAAKYYGICKEAIWPYEYVIVDIEPTPDAFTDALTRKIQRYEVIDKRPLGHPPEYVIEQVKSALNEGLEIAFGCSIGLKWQTLTGPWQEHDYVFPAPGNPYIYSHAMVIIGYDDACQRLLIEEGSKSSEWGDGGFGGMPYSSFINSLYEAYVIRGFDGVYVNDPLQAEWDQIQKLYLGYYGRPADLGGMVYWRDRMIKEGLPAIVAAHMASPEEAVLYGAARMKEANRTTRRG